MRIFHFFGSSVVTNQWTTIQKYYMWAFYVCIPVSCQCFAINKICNNFERFTQVFLYLFITLFDILKLRIDFTNFKCKGKCLKFFYETGHNLINISKCKQFKQTYVFQDLGDTLRCLACCNYIQFEYLSSFIW